MNPYSGYSLVDSFNGNTFSSYLFKKLVYHMHFL